jgi:hypothetical protein
METFKITVTDYNGTKTYNIAANSKYQAMEDVKQNIQGIAEIHCEITDELPRFTAFSSSPVKISKKLAAYLNSFPDHFNDNV